MATNITDVTSWKPLNVTPVTGAIKTAGDAVSEAVSALDGVVQIGATLLRAAALLLPTTVDPAVAALNAAVSAAQKLLGNLAVLDGQYSVLLVPPVVGTGATFVDYISKKLGDATDPFRPQPATNKDVFHAGILVFGTLSTPQGALDAYRAATSLFGTRSRKPSNATGFSTFRPSLKVAAVSGNPLLTWTYPHPLDLLRGNITVRGANGTAYSKVKNVREVVIWRRQKTAGNVVETKLDTLPYNALVTTYTDTTVTEGTYEYAVEFSYELTNGASLGGIKSNWSKINLTKKLKKKATGGGNYPKFMGVQAKYTIEGFETALARANQFMEQFKAADTNFQAEVSNFASFISTYSAQLTQRITTLINHLKRVAANLDTLAQSGLSFVAYEGHPAECLTQIAAKIGGGSASDLYVGLFMNASSESQTLANLSMDGIKKLCGWGGELRVVDTIAKQAQNILKAGTTILTNVEEIGKTTADAVETQLTSLEKAKESLELVAGQGQATGIPSGS